MNIDYNTSLQGHYTFYDENMSVLCETDNLVTDWGMRRFVGDRTTGAPHPADTDESQQAFINNMRFIMLGTDDTPVSGTDFQLISAIPATEYTTTNEGSTTGTLLSTDPADGDLLMIFTRMTRFKMASAFDPISAPSSRYVMNEVGCSWSQTLTSNNRYGIFSRTTLPFSITVSPSTTIFVKYELVVKTNADEVLGNMNRYNGTGAAAFPNNKTNVRELPLFTLQSDGEPAAILTRNSTFPLFEDAGNHNLYYTPRSIAALIDPYINTAIGNCCGSTSDDDTLVAPLVRTKSLWWLQFYTTNWAIVGSLSATNGGSNPSERFNNFTSTTTININNPAVLTTVTTGLNAGGSDYSTVIDQNLRFFVSPNETYTGRKPADSETVSKELNVWTRNIQFIFSPYELLSDITVLKAYRATLGDWNNNCLGRNSIGQCNAGHVGRVFADGTGDHSWGIVTVFDAPYTPNLSYFEGVRYTFRFSRS